MDDDNYTRKCLVFLFFFPFSLLFSFRFIPFPFDSHSLHDFVLQFYSFSSSSTSCDSLVISFGVTLDKFPTVNSSMKSNAKGMKIDMSFYYL